MSEKVLFVLEGASKEPKVIDALWPLAHSWAGVSCPPVKEYKSIVANEKPLLSDIARISDSKWREIICCHLATTALLLSGTNELHGEISQSGIFDVQKRVCISRSCPQVAVLSAFPLFLYDYFGSEKFREMI